MKKPKVHKYMCRHKAINYNQKIIFFNQVLNLVKGSSEAATRGVL